MRKGRFTKQEIRRAIATNSLGVRAFFALLLKVIIADNRLSFKYNKEIRLLYHFKKIIEFGINEDIFYERYSENLKRKLNDGLEGRKYKEFLSIAYEILESPKTDYMNIIDHVFDVFLQKVKTNISDNKE